MDILFLPPSPVPAKYISPRSTRVEVRLSRVIHVFCQSEPHVPHPCFGPFAPYEFDPSIFLPCIYSNFAYTAPAIGRISLAWPNLAAEAYCQYTAPTSAKCVWGRLPLERINQAASIHWQRKRSSPALMEENLREWHTTAAVGSRNNVS